MNFNSFSYFLFLPLTVSVTWLLPANVRKYWLLAVSLFFYAWGKPLFLLLLIASTVIDYTCGLCMEHFSHNRPLKKLFLFCSIFLNLGMLSLFKYSGFLGMTLPLPAGISFYTFQTMSYSIDVYRGDHKAEHDFITFALYVSFFPQLVAGPIESPSHLLPQLKETHTFSKEDLQAGLHFLLCGYFRKYVIADPCGEIVDLVFADIGRMNALSLVIGGAFFCLQMYNDFAGYSLIATGSARLLGIRLVRNFDHPYRSLSYTEFFRRWHISLNKWFTSYVYIPLGGSRGGTLQKLRNIVIVFTLCGLWHGAKFTYVLWGLYAAFWICIETLFLSKMEKALSGQGLRLSSKRVILLRRCCMFLIFIPAGILFRAASAGQVLQIAQKLFLGDYSVSAAIRMLHLDLLCFVRLVLAILCADQMEGLSPQGDEIPLKYLVIASYCLVSIGLCFLSLLEGNGVSGFAYFQF